MGKECRILVNPRLRSRWIWRDGAETDTIAEEIPVQSAKLAPKRRGHRALRLTGMIWSAAVPSGFPERTGDAEPVQD